MPSNGDAIILPTGTVKGLANYPRGRLAPSNTYRTLYISGTSSRRTDGTFDGVKTNADGHVELDVRHQTSAIIRNIEEVIKNATSNEGGLQNVIDATVFLVDMKSHYSGMNAVWNDIWPNVEEAPARTTIGVRELPSPEMIVEIKCTAVVEVTR
ncbi:hypothetical protein CkaCkLH20_05923 [Colletotrichum karsti]|uniref:2-aminomuconate deaminase n=1 Tax=Colletotrichum karsti TaxID=1095194 RepID=A0A9P6I613_9PEZI|nr:uncharacterized protein CkaCkLH20_05923 [Colletotrichum karsti]KAF9876515.1 hypothetical protein CkaCkLH20_05923 [Colletotrichum karsti]